MSRAFPLLDPGRTLGVTGAGVMGRTLAKGLLVAGLVTRRQICATAKTQGSCEDVAESLGSVCAGRAAGVAACTVAEEHYCNAITALSWQRTGLT